MLKNYDTDLIHDKLRSSALNFCSDIRCYLKDQSRLRRYHDP